MSEPTTPATPQETPEAPATSPEQKVDDLPQWARDAITKANREAANYRTQLNEIKPLADQFKQLEDASKSELQRMQEALEAANSNYNTTAAEALQLRTAMKHGIPLDDLGLLGYGSEDELEARAARLAELHAAASKPAAPPQAKSVPDLKPGATPTETTEVDDVAARTAAFFPQWFPQANQ